MKKILVVEDEQNLREGIVTAFTERGWQVTAAEDGADAIRTLEQEVFDVLVTDFQMPGRTGADLLREMRRRGDARPVILTSGYGSELESEDPIQPDLLLGKPLLLADLGRALKEVMG